MTSEKKVHRRHFFSVLGAATLSGVALPAQDQEDDALVISPADSIGVYSELLHKVQLEALENQKDVWLAASARVSQAVAELVDLVKKLVARIPPGVAGPETSLLREFTEAPDSDETRGDTVWLYAVGVRSAALALESAQGLTLDAEATAILRRMLKATEELRNRQSESEALGQQYSASFRRTDEIIGGVRESLRAAMGGIHSSGSVASIPSKDRASVSAHLTSAINRLGPLTTLSAAGALQAPKREQFVTLMRGVQCIVEQRPCVPAVARFSSRSAGFVAVSFGDRSLNESEHQRTRLAQILREHCPSDSLWRVLGVLVLVTPIWAIHNNPLERAPLIRTVLDQGFWCSDGQPCSDAFVNVLARFV